MSVRVKKVTFDYLNPKAHPSTPSATCPKTCQMPGKTGTPMQWLEPVFPGDPEAHCFVGLDFVPPQVSFLTLGKSSLLFF